MFPLARASCEVPATVWYHCLDRYRLLYRLFIGRVCRIPCFGALLFVPSLGRRRPFPFVLSGFLCACGAPPSSGCGGCPSTPFTGCFPPAFFLHVSSVLPVHGRKPVRSAENYLPQGTRVLCGKYSSTLRRVRWRTPHGVAAPTALPWLEMVREKRGVGGKKCLA